VWFKDEEYIMLRNAVRLQITELERVQRVYGW
jgi:hypothetical protein